MRPYSYGERSSRTSFSACICSTRRLRSIGGRVEQREHPKTALGLRVQRKAGGVTAVSIDDLVFVAAAGRGRAHANRIELSLGANVLSQQPKFGVVLLQSGLSSRLANSLDRIVFGSSRSTTIPACRSASRRSTREAKPSRTCSPTTAMCALTAWDRDRTAWRASGRYRSLRGACNLCQHARANVFALAHARISAEAPRQLPAQAPDGPPHGSRPWRAIARAPGARSRRSRPPGTRAHALGCDDRLDRRPPRRRSGSQGPCAARSKCPSCETARAAERRREPSHGWSGARSCRVRIWRSATPGNRRPFRRLRSRR